MYHIDYRKGIFKKNEINSLRKLEFELNIVSGKWLQQDDVLDGDFDGVSRQMVEQSPGPGQPATAAGQSRAWNVLEYADAEPGSTLLWRETGRERDTVAEIFSVLL